VNGPQSNSGDATRPRFAASNAAIHVLIGCVVPPHHGMARATSASGMARYFSAKTQALISRIVFISVNAGSIRKSANQEGRFPSGQPTLLELCCWPNLLAKVDARSDQAQIMDASSPAAALAPFAHSGNGFLRSEGSSERWPFCPPAFVPCESRCGVSRPTTSWTCLAAVEVRQSRFGLPWTNCVVPLTLDISFHPATVAHYRMHVV
jgi:hypothetical protein